ncbi:MAG: cytochrome c biogenesis CcdA family protein [Armatimonadota bacterium]
MTGEQQPAWLVAILAGVFSFISPCVLPLIPGYLSMISGLSVEQLEQRRAGHLVRVLISCLLFSVGFSIVFILVGLSVGTAGQWLQAKRAILNVVFGAIVILFGLFVVGVVRLPFLYADRRIRLRGSLGMWGAPLLGFAFGFGWTPCIGPFLVLLVSIGTSLPPLQSAALFALFSLTLALCFTLAGLLFAYAVRAFAFIQRNYRVVEVISGGILILIGLLLVSQQWDLAVRTLNRYLAPLAARVTPGG